MREMLFFPLSMHPENNCFATQETLPEDVGRSHVKNRQVVEQRY